MWQTRVRVPNAWQYQTRPETEIPPKPELAIANSAEPADKPGSVWPESQRRSFLWAIRRRTPQAIYPGTRRAAVSSPYLILLRVGFAMPCGVSPARGALLPHRFTLATRILRCRSAVCSLLHFPSTRAAQTLSGTLPYGARTFLDALARTAIAWPTPQRHSSVVVGAAPRNMSNLHMRHSVFRLTWTWRTFLIET